jgi:hypothetical protein
VADFLGGLVALLLVVAAAMMLLFAVGFAVASGVCQAVGC